MYYSKRMLFLCVAVIFGLSFFLGLFLVAKSVYAETCCNCEGESSPTCNPGDRTCGYICARGSDIDCDDANNEYDEEDGVTRCNCGGNVCKEVGGDHTCSSYICRTGSVVGSDDEEDEGGDDTNTSTNSSSGGRSTGDASVRNPLGDIDTPQKLISSVINGVIGVIGILAVAALVYGGILYLTSAGNEEQAGKAKKAITYAIVGLLIALLSYAIVNVVIRFIGG